MLCFIRTDAKGIGYRGFPQGSPHSNCFRLLPSQPAQSCVQARGKQRIHGGTQHARDKAEGDSEERGPGPGLVPQSRCRFKFIFKAPKTRARARVAPARASARHVLEDFFHRHLGVEAHVDGHVASDHVGRQLSLAPGPSNACPRAAPETTPL